MHRLETSDNDLNERINVLEERVTALETKPPRKWAGPPNSRYSSPGSSRAWRKGLKLVVRSNVSTPSWRLRKFTMA
jgi:hypothetical protein